VALHCRFVRRAAEFLLKLTVCVQTSHAVVRSKQLESLLKRMNCIARKRLTKFDFRSVNGIFFSKFKPDMLRLGRSLLPL
jgi:hypothetical protein